MKWLKYRDPITGQVVYFKQLGPLYGEASAPVRWFETIAPWLVEQGFVQGENEPCVFYHHDRDVLLLLYVDDCLVDAEADQIEWIFNLLDERFKSMPGDHTPPCAHPHLGDSILRKTNFFI